MSLLKLRTSILVYEDAAPTGNPVLRSVDRTRLISDQAVSRPPLAVPMVLLPGQELVAWDGTRATSLDGTSQLALALSPLAPDRYRLSWTGTGTAPAFRVARAFDASAATSVTLTANVNATATLTSTGGTPPVYTNVQVGDQVLVPGVSTGDAAGPFSETNVGYWVVLGRTSSSLTLGRPAGTSFSAVTQTVTVTAAGQLVAFSAAGVQPDDSLVLLAGFSAPALRTYRVLAVAPGYLDLQSSVPLAAETVTPGAGNVKLYSEAGFWTYLETDQPVSARFNGDTGNLVTVEPVVTDDPAVQPGILVKAGTAWRLAVYNQAAVNANVYVVRVSL